MKSPLVNRLASRSGFTLVELLVVMGIIAILAAVLFGVGGSAIRSAQRAKAQQLANAIQTASLNYYNEYNAYPVSSSANSGQDYLIADSDTTDWVPLIEALCGNVNPTQPSSTPLTGLSVSNARNIAFLQMKATDLVSVSGNLTPAPKNPLPNSSSNPTFNIAFDYDYDGIVGDSGTANGKLIDFVNSSIGHEKFLTNGTTGGVAVWADCNGTTSTSTWAPGFVVRTY